MCGTVLFLLKYLFYALQKKHILGKKPGPLEDSSTLLLLERTAKGYGFFRLCGAMTPVNFL